MLVPIRMAGSIGVVRDVPAHELPVNAWTNSKNVRMFEGFAELSKGYQDAFSADPTIAPLAILPYRSPNAIMWVYTGTAKAYVHDGSSESNITRGSGDYTGTASDRWTLLDFGGVVVLNNGVDAPQQWDGVPTNTAADLSNWPANYTAGAFGKYRNYLVAGDITKSGTRSPHLVLWSDPAETGAVPSSWDVTDATKLAGEKQIREAGGAILDFHEVGDINVIYKEGAMVAQTLTGGLDVFGFRTITEELGIFAKGTIKNFKDQQRRNRSFVFGADDIVVHDGFNIQSVVDQRLRRWLYQNIDTTNYGRAFVANDVRRQEMWACFPEAGHTWCNLALVWNWVTGAFSIEEIPDLSALAYGFYDPSVQPLRYSDLSATPYRVFDTKYTAPRFNPTEKSLLGSSYADTKLYEMNISGAFDGTAIQASMERTAWGFILDRYGKAVPNTELYKMCTEIYPHFDGVGTVQIQVGSQKTVRSPVKWGPIHDFVIGTDKKVNPWIGGNLLSFRILSQGQPFWRMSGMDVDIRIAGSHW